MSDDVDKLIEEVLQAAYQKFCEQELLDDAYQAKKEELEDLKSRGAIQDFSIRKNIEDMSLDIDVLPYIPLDKINVSVSLAKDEEI